MPSAKAITRVDAQFAKYDMNIVYSFLPSHSFLRSFGRSFIQYTQLSSRIGLRLFVV